MTLLCAGTFTTPEQLPQGCPTKEAPRLSCHEPVPRKQGWEVWPHMVVGAPANSSLRHSLPCALSYMGSTELGGPASGGRSSGSYPVTA